MIDDSLSWVDAVPLVNDHPDIAGLFADPRLLAALGPALARPFAHSGITKVVGPETRGMMVGALVASELGTGLVCARKHGQNHPGSDIEVRSSVSWSGESQRFQLRSFDLSPGDIVLLVDDWITTGATLAAVADAVASTGATCAGASVILNKADARVVEDLGVRFLVTFEAVMARSRRTPITAEDSDR